MEAIIRNVFVFHNFSNKKGPGREVPTRPLSLLLCCFQSLLGACYVHVLNNDITSGRAFNFNKTAIRNCYEVGLVTISTRDVNTTSFSSGDSTSCEVINNEIGRVSCRERV